MGRVCVCVCVCVCVRERERERERDLACGPGLQLTHSQSEFYSPICLPISRLEAKCVGKHKVTKLFHSVCRWLGLASYRVSVPLAFNISDRLCSHFPWPQWSQEHCPAHSTAQDWAANTEFLRAQVATEGLQFGFKSAIMWCTKCNCQDIAYVGAINTLGVSQFGEFK